MDILILDSWLREYLDTKARPAQIAKYLSLCGPSVEKVKKINKDALYHIEVTTNRVDMMSILGIAREAAAILPRFRIKASLKPLRLSRPKAPKKSLPLIIKAHPKLVYRTSGIIIDNIQNWDSPAWMKRRLEAAGIRSLNGVIDITNYIMTELGHPMHAFDYDKINQATIIIRESKRGEKIISLEDKKYTLPGRDIVFANVDGEIIDLPGIIGTKNSVVSKNTKRVLFLIDNNEPSRIRKTSMTLGIRTVAATLNEKGVDPELGLKAIIRAAGLAQELCKARIASRVYDSYKHRRKISKVKLAHHFIIQRLGVNIAKKEIKAILNSLEFEANWSGNTLTVIPPGFRAIDISIPEDIVEEVARLYGYHNLPSTIMPGVLPEKLDHTPFNFEYKIKKLLKALGGTEIYTQSLVSPKMAGKGALKLDNPLGEDSAFLRTSLKPSLINAVNQNARQTNPYHLFEMANIYLPRPGKLPEEKMMIAGVFKDYSFRSAKGHIEALLESLNISFQFNRALAIKIQNDLIYYEFEVEELQKASQAIATYKATPKHPPQIEDLTLEFPEKTRLGKVVESISKEKFIQKVELTDIYKGSYTFRVWYLDPKKTLEDKEVEKIRKRVLEKIKKKFGGVVKN